MIETTTPTPVSSSELVLRRERRATHKTCPTWGETQCCRQIFVNWKHRPRISYRWRNVTCEQCLRDKPHNAQAMASADKKTLPKETTL